MGYRSEVPRVLRRLQHIQIGKLTVCGAQSPVAMTAIPLELNDILAKTNLLKLFATPGKWVQTRQE